MPVFAGRPEAASDRGSSGEERRFHFGKNWKSFLAKVDEDAIRAAERSICELLETDSLEGRRLLDVGCGSGLFSLSARRLGAAVHSFDYDPECVACAEYLRGKYYPGDNDWRIERGSILDREFTKSLGTFDVVYAWGVLHHTGDLLGAMDNVSALVKADGILCLAIYNDQEWVSKLWRIVKTAYCSRLPGRLLIVCTFIPYFFLRAASSSFLKRRNTFAVNKKYRGISIFNDWLDWLGGLPYEVAKPADVVGRYTGRGFRLRMMVLSNGNGCNQYVFTNVTRPTVQPVEEDQDVGVSTGGA